MTKYSRPCSIYKISLLFPVTSCQSDRHV